MSTPDIAAVTTHKYIEKLKNKMKWAFKKAAEISLKESARQKRYYDKKMFPIKNRGLSLGTSKGFQRETQNTR